MKVLIIFLFSFNLSIAQVVTGKYYCSGDADKLTIRSDSMFFEELRGHLFQYWYMGKWTIKNDIITLTQIPIFDTIKISNSDTLVFSMDTISQRLTYNQYQEIGGYGNSQANVGNHRVRLLYKNDNLFPINSKGKIIKKHPGSSRERISLRNHRIDKPPIVLFSWKKMYPQCFFERVK